MKLNVSTRIIAGFATLTILLLLLGIVNWLSNQSLKTTTAITQQLTIPTLTSTTRLSATLGEAQRILLVGYYNDSVSLMPDILKQYAEEQALFNQEIQTLTTLVQQQPKVMENLQSLKQQYQQFSEISNRLLNDRKQILDTQESLVKQQRQLERELDEELGTTIMTLTDLELSDDLAEQQAAKTASVIDNNLSKMMTSVYDMVLVTEQGKFELLINELSYIANNVIETVNRLQQQATTNGPASAPNLTKFKQAIQTFTLQINGEQSIQAQKAAQLKLTQNAANILSETAELKKTMVAKMKQLSEELKQLSEQLNAQAMAKIDNSALNTLIVVLIAIIVAIGVAVAVIVPLKRSLNNINSALTVIAGGDLTHKLNDIGEDELADVAKNCNTLINSLRDVISSIIDRSSLLTRTAEQTSQVTDNAVGHIQQQKQQIVQAAAATDQLESSATQVSDSADSALMQIQLASEQTQSMTNVMEQNQQTILVLAQEVIKATEVIDSLHQNTNAIDSILEVIRGVAEQTNLLALNAAIEAARAGEQGRGFAVVADEVRNLASRTQESTNEIRQMIEMLQQGALQAVKVMSQGQQQAQACVETTATTQDALRAITEAVQQAHQAGSQIAAAAQEQRRVSNQISTMLSDISQLSDETTAGASKTADSSNEVAQLAEALQASVRQFRI
ncbi:methyl-accepting chemotaxis protein [Shewanella sp.]|uniref:methyl-accepting chemotaxis protein n=1 Tax=Shewanella sp. TaxID=50422 RepID=UPI003A98022C